MRPPKEQPTGDTLLVDKVRVTRRRPTAATPWHEWSLTWHYVRGGKRLRRTPRFGRLPAAAGKRQRDDMEARAQLAAVDKTFELVREANGNGRTLDLAKPIEAAMTDYLCSCEGRFSQAAMDARERTLRVFGEYLREVWPKQWEKEGPAAVSQLDPSHVLGFLAWRRADGKGYGDGRRKDNTLHHEMLQVAGFIDHALKMGWRREPLTCVPSELRPHHAEPVVVEDSRILATLQKDVAPVRRAAFAVLAATGLRSGELASLRAEHYNPNTRTIHVPPGLERTKRHKRDTGLGKFAAAVLEPIRGTQPGEPLVPGIRGTRLNEWLAPYDLCPKQFRQWFCSTLERLECPDYIVRALMGHAPDKVRRHYSFRLADGRPWLEQIDGILAGTQSLPGPG